MGHPSSFRSALVRNLGHYSLSRSTKDTNPACRQLGTVLSEITHPLGLCVASLTMAE